MRRSIDTKKIFRIVIILTVLFILYAISTLLPRSERTGIINKSLNRLEVSINMTELIGSMDVDVVYRRLHRKYQANLDAIPRHTYKHKDNFIDYGEPVHNVLPKNRTKVPVILQWTGFFSDRNWMPKEMSCPRNLTCVTTNDKNAILRSDAVVMHSWDVQTGDGIPKQRLPHQRWIHFLQEGPYLAQINIKDYNGVFNWTSTYRLDSDIPAVYLSTQKRSENLTESEFQKWFSEIKSTKSKFIAQMNSNCLAPHTNRLAYVQELRKYIPVDTYGKCGELQCKRYTPECRALMSKYKFYMSMENSNCREYITEKVTQPLYEWNSVPVVMGGADPGDYEKILPPGSYIHTSAFNSVKELAEYLVLLDKYPHLYEKYHRWRITHKRERNEWGLWCNMCRMLHNDSLPVQTYRDFIGWYNEDTCKT